MQWGKTDWGDFDDEPDQSAPEPAPRSGRSTGKVRWALLVFALLALAVAGSVLAFRLPALGGRESTSTITASTAGQGRFEPLGGPRVAVDPSTYTLHGRTASTNGAHSVGPVVLRGRWNGGEWLVLRRATTDPAGNFTVATKLRRRGVLELRLSLPDGFVGTKTLQVR